MRRWGYGAGLALIVVAGLVLRLLLWRNQGAASMVFPGDQDEYYRGAIHLALQGDYYDNGQWMRPPLTSLFFALCFVLLGVNLPAALLAQCVLSAALPLPLAGLARRLFGSRRTGLVAALWGALFLPFATYGSQLLSEAIFTLCIALALWLLEIARQQDGSRWLVAGGAAWGLAALARPVGLYALPLLLLWVAWEQRRVNVSPVSPSPLSGGRGWGMGGQSGWRRIRPFALRPLALLLGFVLVVGPWTARNYGVYGQLVLVDTNGGVSFWLGNLLTPEERDLQQVWNETLPNSALRQQVALRRGIANIATDPGLFVARLRYKTVSLWQLDTRLFAANDTRGPTWDDSALWFAALSDAQYVLMVLAALLGLWLAPRAARSPALLGWPLYGTLLCAVTLGHPRLRVPLLVSLAVYAALPLAHPRATWARLRASSPPWRLSLGAAVLAFGLLIYAGALGPLIRGQFWLALRPILGEAALDRAVAADPGGYLPFQALGDARLARGDAVGALAAYTQGATNAPANAPLQARRIALLRAEGDAAAARAALAPLAAVGWDNPQLYAWAFDALPERLRGPLDPALPATGYLTGVYAAETAGPIPYRWALGRARIRFAANPADSLTLTLRAPRPDTPVTVYFRGVALATLRVGVAWQTFELPVANPDALRGGDGEIGVVELQAPEVVVGPNDPYPRAVAIAGAELHFLANPR